MFNAAGVTFEQRLDQAHWQDHHVLKHPLRGISRFHLTACNFGAYYTYPFVGVWHSALESHAIIK